MARLAAHRRHGADEPLATDTGDLIDALRLKHPTVVGWSMGGEIGLADPEAGPEVFRFAAEIAGLAG
jgi:pimeloyl-ACP methyl ester carboxylesterase